jgi:hypothetical protein
MIKILKGLLVGLFIVSIGILIFVGVYLLFTWLNNINILETSVYQRKNAAIISDFIVFIFIFFAALSDITK